MHNDIENNVKKLLPHDLKKIKIIVDALLDDKINSRVTNVEYQNLSKKIFCPVDKNHHIKKNGHKNNIQRFICLDCNKSFSITNNSIISSSTLNYDTLMKVLKGLYDFKPLRDIAQEAQISTTSLFELQMKLYESLNSLNDIKLSGVVQADEMYVNVNFKGTKPSNMPRISKKNGKSHKTAGTGDDFICVIAAIDNDDNIILEVSDVGSASIKQISDILDNRIEPNSILVVDSKSSYVKFANRNKLKLVQIPSGKHQKDGYHINDVNELMTEISVYITNKRGISSKHLQQHLNFIKYRKIVKYTIDYLKINEKMYRDSIVVPTTIKSNDVYSKNLPFDLEKYKKWYRFYGND